MSARFLLAAALAVGAATTSLLFAAGGEKGCDQYDYNSPIAPEGAPCNESYHQFETVNNGSCTSMVLVENCETTENEVLVHSYTLNANCAWIPHMVQVAKPGGGFTTEWKTKLTKVIVCSNS
jgi:hypothetical protein